MVRYIVIVTDTFIPDMNGAAKSLAYVRDHLLELGVEVEVICPQAASSLAVPSRSLPYYPAIRMSWVNPRVLKKRWKKRKPDAVYIAVESVLGLAARQAAKRLKIKVLAGYHTNFPQYFIDYNRPFLSKVIFRYMRWFHNGAAVTLVPSDSVKKELSNGGYKNVCVMGRGVELELYSPKKRSVDLRLAWGGGENGTVALFAGRISLEKNLELLAQAFREMRKACPELVCVVVGDGPSLERFKSENPDFLYTGFLSSSDLAVAYASADILVFPSKTETFGNAVTEALASGMVVVAYDYAAGDMYIEDEVSGLLVPMEDEEGELFVAKSVKALEYVSNEDMRAAAVKEVKGARWRNVAQKVLEIAEISASP